MPRFQASRAGVVGLMWLFAAHLGGASTSVAQQPAGQLTVDLDAAFQKVSRATLAVQGHPSAPTIPEACTLFAEADAHLVKVDRAIPADAGTDTRLLRAGDWILTRARNLAANARPWRVRNCRTTGS